jgi:hypothetical protein
VNGSSIKTIEGNTSNMVKEHTYNTSDSYIAGYGHPKYSEETSTSTSTSTSTFT